jgi:hypothetical protein
MLPNPDDRPPSLLQALVGVAIPQPVGLDLLAPEVLVRLRPGCVFGAAMPETSVDEDRDARGAEHYVCATTSIR